MYNITPETNIIDNVNGREPVEYAWDFEKEDLILVNGRTTLVYGIEAIKIWIWKCLKTARLRYPIYTSDFGSELSGLIGVEYEIVNSEVQRMIKEALLVNPYINNVDNFIIEYKGDRLDVEFTVYTNYGNYKELTTMEV